MLVTSLLATLLAPSVSPPDQYDLAGLLVDGAEFQMLVGDLSSMLRDDVPGPLERLFQDGRFFRALELIEDDKEGLDAFETEAAFEIVRAAAVHVQAAAIASGFAGGEDLMAVTVTPGFRAALNYYLDDPDFEVAEVEYCGRTLIKVVDPSSGTYLIANEGSLWVLWFAEEVQGTLEDKCAFVVGRFEEVPSPPEKPWWERVEPPVAETVVQLFVGFDRLVGYGDPRPELVSSTDGGICIAIGQSATVGLELGVALLDPGYGVTQPVLDAFHRVDPGMLTWAPKESAASMAVGLDLGDFLRGALETAKKLGQLGGNDPATLYAKVLAVGESTLGMDVEESILQNLTGDFFLVLWGGVFEAVLAAQEDPTALLDGAFVLGCTFRDNEPFYGVLEVLEPYMGNLNLKTESRHGYDVWTVEPKTGVLISLALGESALMVGADAHLDEVLERTAKQGTDGLVVEGVLRAATNDLAGQGLVVIDAAAAFGAIEAGLASAMDLPKGKQDGFFMLMDAFSDVAGDSLLMSAGLAKDRVMLRMLAR